MPLKPPEQLREYRWQGDRASLYDAIARKLEAGRMWAPRPDWLAGQLREISARIRIMQSEKGRF